MNKGIDGEGRECVVVLIGVKFLGLDELNFNGLRGIVVVEVEVVLGIF